APGALLDAVATYRREFQPSDQLAEPYVIAGVNAIASDDRDDALEQLTQVKRARVLMLLRQSGQVPLGRTFTHDELDMLLDSPVGAQVASMTHYTGVGTGAEVSEYVSAFAERAGADEVIVAHSSIAVDARLRSVELLAAAHR